MLSDADRHELYVAIRDTLGEHSADLLMRAIPTIDWTDIARRSDLSELRSETKLGFAELDGKIADLKGEMYGVKGEMYELKGEVYELKGEVAELRSRLDTQTARIMVANVPIMFGVAGLVLAAAKLA